ncbi:MAG: cobyrinate a,c-diamide synthase [Lachnospiraceae bacterium]|nr:cobyrinate a,c-diamide synthase [Lachnospiraceae bacterium]
MKSPRIMLAAPASGSGKTLITCGILQALVNRGLQVASFKCGPDYIDPMFHQRVIGAKSGNLDTFFTDPATTRYLFGRAAADQNISVVEGVMGYYDGLGGVCLEGSSYDVARTLDIPVVLLVNCAGQSLSVLSVMKGFLEYQSPSMIQGVIFNRMSPMIYERLREIAEHQFSVRVLGYVPPIKDLDLKSRHLGLVLPHEVEELKENLQRLAEILEETLDLDGLIALSQEAPSLSYHPPEFFQRAERKPVSIALAKDEAFCFTYRDNLELLEQLGARLVPFSPLEDKEIPRECRGMILSGGYPELHARRLSENVSLRQSIREAIARGMPCIAECGGFLYLHEELEGPEGICYPMVGSIPGRAYGTERLGRFGYITLTARQDQLLLAQGEQVRGHEFHYWESENCGESLEAQKPVGKRSWSCGHGTKTLYAGFPHLFYYSNPQVALNFLKKCEESPCLS